MFGFTYYSPTEIVFGPETEALAGPLVRKWGGSRVLVVCGGHSARSSGLLDRVVQSLTQEGLACMAFGPSPGFGRATGPTLRPEFP